jgi:hypothetical protein
MAVYRDGVRLHRQILAAIPATTPPGGATEPLPLRQLGTDESVQRHVGFGRLDGEPPVEMRRDAHAKFTAVRPRGERHRRRFLRARGSGDLVWGSPTNALALSPPFKEYHFIDLDQGNIERLRMLIQSRLSGPYDPQSVYLYNADCNDILIENIFPRVR